MKKYTKKQVNDFLTESNAIEGVYDKGSLKQAQLAWDYLIAQDQITIPVVLETHRILMLNQDIQPDEKGFFRKCEVRIGMRFGLNYVLVPAAMKDWVLDTVASVKVPGEDGKHIRIDHITYEKIHPFVDGNGRTGRMFMNWERMKAGLPILIIHADLDKLNSEQRAYYNWFR